MTRDQIIDHYVDRLRTLGARNVDEYQSRLRSNAGNLANLNNFLSEAAAALMLRDYGAEVTMQDRPDLAAVLKDKRFYVEVKHFNRKGQDDLNDEAERNAPEGEFVLLEHTARSEGKTRYRQIADVAIRKADQYREGEINILIIDSDSETLHLMAGSGAQEFSDDKQSEPPDSPLHRLNGIMVMTSLIGVRGGHWNVDFAITRCPSAPDELSASSGARGNQDGNGQTEEEGARRGVEPFLLLRFSCRWNPFSQTWPTADGRRHQARPCDGGGRQKDEQW